MTLRKTFGMNRLMAGVLLSDGFIKNAHRFLQQHAFSTAEAMTALRPFYFLVHPDFFGRYPKIQSVNENSLKLLNDYLDSLLNGRPVNSTKRLTFYLRNKVTGHILPTEKSPADDSSGPKTVSIVLSHGDPYSLVRYILEVCSLSTENLLEVANHSTVLNDFKTAAGRSETYKREPQLSLESWVTKLASRALKQRALYRAVCAHADGIVSTVKNAYHLRDVTWDSPWSVLHFQSCLTLFRDLLSGYPEFSSILRGRKVMFGLRNYVSADNRVVFNVADVPQDWLHLATSLGHVDMSIARLVAINAGIGDCLQGVQVSCLPTDSVFHVLEWSERLLSNFSSTTTYAPLSNEWRDVTLIVQDEHAGFCVTASGSVMIPCSSSLEQAVRFLSENLSVVRDRVNSFARKEKEAASLKSDCIDKFRLDSIGWHSDENADLITSALKKLLSLPASNCFTGQALFFGNISYNVMPDGAIGVPLEWRC